LVFQLHVMDSGTMSQTPVGAGGYFQLHVMDSETIIVRLPAEISITYLSTPCNGFQWGARTAQPSPHSPFQLHVMDSRNNISYRHQLRHRLFLSTPCNGFEERSEEVAGRVYLSTPCNGF